MNKLLFAPVALSFLVATAFAQEGPPKAPAPVPCEEFIQDLQGLTLDAPLTFRLSRSGLTLRIISENGRAVPTTYDFRPNRVNVELQDRKILRAYCG